MKRLVIFDLDGTLLHTLPGITYCINGALEATGLKPISEDYVRDHVCYGTEYLAYNACKNPELVPLIIKFYSELCIEYACEKTTLFDGILDLLTELKKREIKLAILTNKSNWRAELLYEKFFAKYEFDGVWGRTVNKPLKPDPTMLNELLDELLVHKSEAIMVGDGDTDVLVSKNAGVDFVGVTWGYCKKEKLESLGAKNFISNPLDLLKYV